MMDGKDMALIKAAQLVGYVMSAEDCPPSNAVDWHKRACEIAEGVSKAIAACYSPMFMADDAGKVIQVK